MVRQRFKRKEKHTHKKLLLVIEFIGEKQQCIGGQMGMLIIFPKL